MPHAALPSAVIDPAQPVGPQLYRALRRAIVEAELTPGTRLSEGEVAQRHAISRQPVREAFIRLKEEGLVEIRPQRGTFVSRINIDSILSAQFVREAVEVGVVRLLTLATDKGWADRLADQIELQRDAVAAAAPQRFFWLDEQFHMLLAELAGQSGSWALLLPIKLPMDRLRNLSARKLPLEPLFLEHQEIVAAITSGDAARADLAIRRHVSRVLDKLPAFSSMLPDYFDRPPTGTGGT